MKTILSKNTLACALAIALGAAAASQAARAEVSADEAKQLGKSLTMVGANPEANADGTIPKWGGATDKPVGDWKWGKVRIDFSRYKDEKPLFTIDASNVDKYKDKLTPGEL